MLHDPAQDAMMMGGQPDPSLMMGGGQPPEEDGDPFQKIIAAVRAAVEEDGTVSPAEMVIVEQITTLVAKLQAGRDKEREAALGGGPATQFLARKFGGG